MIKCERCDQPATHSTTVNVPAKGDADRFPAAKLYLGEQCCFEHAKQVGEEFNLDDFKGLKDSIESNLKISGKIPDFEKIFKRVVKLDDPGFMQYQKFIKPV
jgi:hypothetical protein